MAKEIFLVGKIRPTKVLFGQIQTGKTPSGGCCRYEDLPDKPSINGVVLVKNKTLEELGIAGIDNTILISDELILDGGNSAK